MGGGAYFIYNYNVFKMADIQKLNVNNTTYDISTTWSKVTGKPSTFPPESHSHSNYIEKYISVNTRNMNGIKEPGIYYGYNMSNAGVTDISNFIILNYSNDWGTQLQFSAGSSRAFCRFWQGAGGVMQSTWKEFSFEGHTHSGYAASSHTHDDRYYTESEINTKLNGKSDTGHTHNYLPLSGGTMTGSITMSQPSSNRRVGIVGTYDPDRAAAIWSMGSSYQIATDGLSFGSLYGAAYAYYGSGYTFGAGKSGGHSFVWCQAGSPTSALGDNVWTSGGFIKNGSNNSYVLLGGGGHKAESSLSVNYANSAGSAVDQTARNAASAAQTTANSKWTYNASTIAGVKVNNAGNSDTVGGYSAGSFALIGNPNNMMHSGNEYTYAPNGYSGDIWHNYRTAAWSTNGSIANYRFGNGAGGYANVCAAAFYQSSDERLKTFYDPIKVDLEKLKTLRKNYFKFNDNDKLEIGVSAQEIQAIYPEIVSESENGYLSVAYDKLSVIALSAIDELDDKILKLADKISTLENIINKLMREKGIN